MKGAFQVTLKRYASCLLLIAGAGAPAAFAQSPGNCPPLAEANNRLQARVEYLLKEVDRIGSKVRAADQAAFVAADPSLPNLYVAFANVIATRAKEEARLWLVDKITDEICDEKKEISAFFPNICGAVKAAGEYPGASFSVIKTRLREDIYALPACYLYPRTGAPSGRVSIFATPDAAGDDRIDPYVLEAALVGVYLLSKEGTTQPPEAPSIGPLPDKTQLAKILLAAASQRFRNPSFAGAGHECKPSDDQIVTLLKALSEKLNSPARTVESILVTLRDQMKPWCSPASDALEAVGDVYVPAVRGDYYEAAFAAAGSFLCKPKPDGTSNDSPVCKRLPLFAEVASAKDQAEMEAALDRVISPLGAWKRKQSEPVWSLNSMAGLSYGSEKLKDTESSESHSTYGLYMPIALEYSRPLPRGWFRAVAIGVTLLDLGGIVSYSDKDRLDGGETSTSANANWSSLAAPGAYVAVAIKDSPFRMGVSYSKTPKLRSVNFTDGTEKDVDSKRLLFFVTVDVTLLTF